MVMTPSVRRYAAYSVHQSRRSARILDIFLAIANSARDDQFRPWKLADGEFVDFGVRFFAVDRYNRADRSHIVAPVGENVLIVRLLRLGRNAVSDRGR